MKRNGLLIGVFFTIITFICSVLTAGAEVYINNFDEPISVNEGSPIDIPILFIGGSLTGNPIELFVWKVDNKSGAKKYFSQTGWQTFTDNTSLAPLLNAPSMLKYAYVKWRAFEDSTGMDSFNINICLDGTVDNAYVSATAVCGSGTVNITAAPACSDLTVSPASITETITVGGTKSVDITVTDSCGNVEAAKFSATGSASWIKPGTPQTGKITVTLDATALSAGNHSGTITVTSGSEIKTISVSLTVSGSNTSTCSTLAVSPASITKTVSKGQTGTETLTITNSCGSVDSANYTATASQTWMTLTKLPGSLTVALSTATLNANSTYTGTITITSGGETKTVNVSLTVSKASISIGGGTCTGASISLGTANLSAYQNATASTTVSVANNCGSAVSFTTGTPSASWLSVTGSSGTMTVTANTTGMSAGTYQGTLSVASSGLTSATLTVYLTVTGPCTVASVSVSPSSISTSVTTGSNAASSSVAVTNNCSSSVSYTVTAVSGTWITAPAVNATGTGSFNVNFNTSSLAAGTYNGSITVSSTGLSSATINVTLVVSTPSVSGTATALSNNGKKYFISINAGEAQYYYFNENSDKGTGNNNSLMIDMADMTQGYMGNVDMVVKYVGATCDDTQKPSVSDLTSIKNGTITGGQNGYYFALSSGAFETIEITSNSQGCYYIMLINVDTQPETNIRIGYTDYDSVLAP